MTQLGTTNQELANLTTVVSNNYKDLQGQIDGAISTWFYNYEPNTPNTLPTKDWTTDAIKDQQLGDLFYIVDNNGKTYNGDASSTFTWSEKATPLYCLENTCGTFRFLRLRFPALRCSLFSPIA